VCSSDLIMPNRVLQAEDLQDGAMRVSAVGPGKRADGTKVDEPWKVAIILPNGDMVEMSDDYARSLAFRLELHAKMVSDANANKEEG